MSTISPLLNYIPKDICQQNLFLTKYPEFDGRGIKIAVIDGAVDLSLEGLQKTSDGLPKIFDCFDFSGAGDVDTSVIKEMDAENYLIGLSGRKLKVPTKWKNPSKKWHLGLKSLYKPLTKLNEKLPEFDCIVWFNGTKWVACIDTLKDDLENAKVLGNFRDENEYDILTFSHLELSYCITIDDGGNLLQIFTSYCEHSSYVTQVAAAYFFDNSDQNGLAPGAQIVSMNVMHPEKSIIYSALKEALLKCIEMKVDIINYSMDHFGKIEEIANIINKIAKNTNILIFIASGNRGPLHFTVCRFDLEVEESTFTIGALSTNDILKRICKIDGSKIAESPPTVFAFSSRGPGFNGSRGLDFVAPGTAVLDSPRFMNSKNKFVFGTSLSSPNAAGIVACLLSALKKNSIQFSPASIKFALSQTAILPKHEKKCKFGHGIIQIDAAFEYCKNAGKELKILNCKNGAGGIIFIKDKGSNLNMKQNIDLRPFINIFIGKKTCKNWILKIPGNPQNIISVTKIHKSGTFLLNADTSKIETGSLKYFEIEVINPLIGCICYIPVTVIVPLKGSLESENQCNQKEITLNYENPCHIFIDPPSNSANKYEIKITPLKKETKTNLFIEYSFGDKEQEIINVNKCPNGIVEIYQKNANLLRFRINETFQAKPKRIHEICIYQRKGSPSNQNFLLQFKFF